MKVSEVTAVRPVCVEPHVSLIEVTRPMAECAATSVLAVEDGALHGTVTDRDLFIRGTGGGLDPKAPVDAVMSPRVVTVEAVDEPEVACRTFRRTGVRRLPVPDAGRVVGVDDRRPAPRRLPEARRPAGTGRLERPV
ncbi:CBS domain-containing protein [Streptomyces sp. NPDC096012]|uniref:CBS domain-containing protein n=1 Tax=Streptomyces sp. NPDC096012 TaxID=3155684 RepID=UPI00336A71FF